jgi:parallel beta-helix repeat protein
MVTRRDLIAGGGLATGIAAVQAMAGPVQPAFAAVTTDRDAHDVTQALGPIPGADNTGTNDATSSIQSMIDFGSGAGGGTLFFPVGTYKVSSTIIVKSNVSIVCGGNSKLGGNGDRGSGLAGTATLLGAPGFTDTILKTPSAVSTTVGVIISNLRVVGPDALTDRPSVLIDQGNFIRIEHCAFWRRGQSVISWKAGSNSAFTYNFVDGHGLTGCVGMSFDGVDTQVTCNNFTATGHCLDFLGEHCIVSDNFCYNSNTGSGIHVGSVRNTFIGNRVDENASSGFLVEGSSNVITGNLAILNGTVASGERAGVHIASGQGNVVSGNTFSNWTHNGFVNTQQYGVSLTGTCSSNAVVGNTFIAQAVGGVHNTSTGTGNVISGNAGQP